MKVLITGSSGLIGSEAVKFYDQRAQLVVGLDNNMREFFFGSDGDTVWRRKQLESQCPNFKHHNVDIRNRGLVLQVVSEVKPDLIIHCAAQPSHDLAAKIPFEDFDVNAVGTLNLLEATRREAPDATFIFMSTNKVYGDAPNYIKLQELDTRWDYDSPEFINGIPEAFSIDQSLHSLFGASKVAADVMVQEYGRYFEMRTAIFRGGCLTGPGHAGAELHGFLSYFFKAAHTGKVYTIYGYKGKQVRDQIHSEDVVRAFDEFYKDPKCAAVYNLGGGKTNSASILECIDKVEQLLGKKVHYEYQDQNRIGDHMCYYSDLAKFRNDYPNWSITHSLDDILEELAQHYSAALASEAILNAQPQHEGQGTMGQYYDEPIEQWTAKRRGTLVLRVLKGETSVTEAARQHGLTVAEVMGWQDQFLRIAENGLGHWPKNEALLDDEQIKTTQIKDQGSGLRE